MASNNSPSSPPPPPPPSAAAPDAAATSAAFQAFYLQRLTAELAEDLDQLRTAPDFVAPGKDGAGASSANSGSAGRAPVSTTDNSVQMLVGALRQGAAMFTPEEQRRVVGSAGTSTRDKKAEATAAAADDAEAQE